MLLSFLLFLDVLLQEAQLLLQALLTSQLLIKSYVKHYTAKKVDNSSNSMKVANSLVTWRDTLLIT